MPRKRHSPEQILPKLREVKVAPARVEMVARAVKQLVLTEQNSTPCESFVPLSFLLRSAVA